MKSDIKIEGSGEMKNDIKVEGSGQWGDEKVRDRERLEKVYIFKKRVNVKKKLQENW